MTCENWLVNKRENLRTWVSWRFPRWMVNWAAEKMKDRLWEVKYLYNVTGAVQGESSFVWAAHPSEAWETARLLHYWFNRPSVYDLSLIGVDVADQIGDVPEGMKRDRWEAIFADPAKMAVIANARKFAQNLEE